jgi:hypothetical protein
MSSSPSFEISADVRALADYLLTVPVGGIATYERLSGIIGREVRSVRHLLTSARRIVQRDNGAVFGSVSRIGVQRVTTEQIPLIGHTARRRIRRSAKAAGKTITAAMSRANDVDNKTRLQGNREISILGLIEETAKDRHASASAPTDDKPTPIAVTARQLLENLTK